MSKLTLNRNHCKGQLSLLPPMVSTGDEAKRVFTPKNRVDRSANIGWSFNSLKSCSGFLYALDVDVIRKDYDCFWCTFTFRDCPPTPKECAKVRLKFFDGVKKFSERNNIKFEYFWLMEFQVRNVPHFHMLLFFDFPDEMLKPARVKFFLGLSDRWLSASIKFRSAPFSQDVRYLKKDELFLKAYKYCLSHSRRDCLHEQRMFCNIPSVWQGLTGAVWGKSRGLPQYSLELDLCTIIMRKLYAHILDLKAVTAAKKYSFAHSDADKKFGLEVLQGIQDKLDNLANNEDMPYGFHAEISIMEVMQFLVEHIDFTCEFDQITIYKSFDVGETFNVRDYLVDNGYSPF